jgi:hypothetical protein
MHLFDSQSIPSLKQSKCLMHFSVLIDTCLASEFKQKKRKLNEYSVLEFYKIKNRNYSLNNIYDDLDHNNYLMYNFDQNYNDDFDQTCLVLAVSRGTTHV